MEDIRDDIPIIQDNHQYDNLRIQPDQPVGDSMMIPKPNEWTRIMVQNTNGISIGKDGDFAIALDHIQQMEVDMMIITEANLDTSQSRVKATMHNDLRKMFGLATYHLVTSASPQL
jgi:hypothetical protein